MARIKSYSDKPSPSGIKRPVKQKNFSPVVKARRSSTGDKYRDKGLSKGRDEAQLKTERSSELSGSEKEQETFSLIVLKENFYESVTNL